MHRVVALVFLAASLSIGASRCGRGQPAGPPNGAPLEGEGSAGGPAAGSAAPACPNGDCEARPGDGSAPRAPVCGGIAGRECPGSGRCVDDPSDSCDPRRGGADCGGLCKCDATFKCAAGSKADTSPAVCGCVPDGGGTAGRPGDRPPTPGPTCGKNTCAAGQYCCNPSCGICAPAGGACTQQIREEPEPTPDPVKCGTNTCAEGEECCNASCGICVKPGEGCTKQLCPDPGDPGDPEPIPGQPCDTKCEPGMHCEYQEVVCIRAPCPPLPTCVETPRCGGFAGEPCPGAGMCEDDPSDDCDPNNGGADCGGLCECQLQGVCKDGQTWNASPTVCGCEPAPGGDGGGVQCGKRTCEKGQLCCNASCGICAGPNEACIQIACL